MVFFVFSLLLFIVYSVDANITVVTRSILVLQWLAAVVLGLVMISGVRARVK